MSVMCDVCLEPRCRLLLHRLLPAPSCLVSALLGCCAQTRSRGPLGRLLRRVQIVAPTAAAVAASNGSLSNNGTGALGCAIAPNALMSGVVVRPDCVHLHGLWKLAKALSACVACMLVCSLPAADCGALLAGGNP